MTQRIREAERELKYEEYAGREGDIVTGIIQQTDSRYTLLDLGRVEALLPQAEQVPYERPEPNTRLKAYIVEVRRTAKGPQIVVSRTHPGLILALFELEVPEIADGIVEIKACAREPGHRTKIAVWSNDANVDPVGACVGARGARVRMVVNELNGEKIDIVPFSDDSYEFVMKALSPAKVKEVRIDPDTGTAEVIVPDFQLSARHRQGGPERPAGGPAHGLAGRHQERDPDRRGGGLRRRGVGRGPVGRRRGHRRAGLAARRGRPGAVGGGVGQTALHETSEEEE
jgi:transcription termination/antitermination protein NusA